MKNIFAAIISTIISIFILSFIFPFIPGFSFSNTHYSSLLTLFFYFLPFTFIGIKNLVTRILPCCIGLGIVSFLIVSAINTMGAGFILIFVEMFIFGIVALILICAFSLKLFEILENSSKYYIVLYVVISILMLIISWNNITNFIANKETDHIVESIHKEEKSCISIQEMYGVPFDMLIKTCDDDYEINVSKKVCERLVNNKYDSAQYESALERYHLDDAIVKSVSNNGNELTKKSCKKTNLIKFNLLPNLDTVKNNYNPKKVDNVEYVNFNGKIRTSQEVSNILKQKSYDEKLEQKRNKKNNNVYKSKSIRW